MKRLVWVLVLLGVLLGSAFAQDLSKVQVSLKTRVVSLSQALTLLSKETGVEFAASTRVATEPVMILVQDVSLDELMQRLAATIEGEWTQSGAKYTLSRSESTERAQAKRDIKKLADRLRAEICEMSDPLQTAQAFDANFLNLIQQRVNSQRALDPHLSSAETDDYMRSPEQRLLIKLVALLPLEEVVFLQKGRSMTFAVQPNAMQKSMPSKTNELIENLRREIEVCNSYYRARDAGLIERLPDERSDDDVDGFMRLRPEIGPLKRVLLNATKLETDDDYCFNLILFGLDGKSVLNRTIAFGPNKIFFGYTVCGTSNALRLPVRVPDLSHLILSPETSWFLDYIRRCNEQSFGADSPLQLTKVLSTPTQYDPLNFVVGDIICNFAEQEQANVVASVPDESMELYDLLTELGRVEAKHLADVINQASSLELRRENGWVLISSTAPSLARRERLNRVAFQELIESQSKYFFIPLEDSAKFALRNPFPRLNPLYRLMSPMVCPTANSHISDSVSYDYLKIFGLLTPKQRADCESNSGLAAITLSDDQRELLEEVFFSNGGRINWPSTSEDESISRISLSFFRNDHDEKELADEPTEAFPFGIPPGATIEMTTTRDEMFLPSPFERFKWLPSADEAFTIERIAVPIAFKELYDEDPTNKDLFEYRDMPVVNGLYFGERVYRFWSFRFAPKLEFNTTSFDLVFAPQKGPTPVSHLPKELYDRLRLQVEKLKRAFRTPRKADPPRGFLINQIALLKTNS